jgi:hypothetical protein
VHDSRQNPFEGATTDSSTFCRFAALAAQLRIIPPSFASKLTCAIYFLQFRVEPILEGYQIGNVLASYVHLHFGSNTGAATSFVETCKRDASKEAAVAAASASAVAASGEFRCFQAFVSVCGRVIIGFLCLVSGYFARSSKRKPFLQEQRVQMLRMLGNLSQSVWMFLVQYQQL